MTKILTIATAKLQSGQLDDINHFRFPRVDYLRIQDYLDTDIIDYRIYDGHSLGSNFQWIETKLRSDLFLAFKSRRQSTKYDLVFAMSERAGIPYAALQKVGRKSPPFVAMFQCWSHRQQFVITKLNLFKTMNAIIVHSQSMKEHFVRLGAPEHRTHVVNYSVDEQFFAPQPDLKQEAGFIIGLGETRSRNYHTLFKAVADLPIKLLIVPSGAWYAREKNKSLFSEIPSNVTVSKGFSRRELRELYSRSQFVVLPIYDFIYSAGSTVALESACMGRAVIATRSRGITDYIIHGETGILVSPGNVDEWRKAIQWMLDHPAETRQMGENARRRIEKELNLDNYVIKIANILRTCPKE